MRKPSLNRPARIAHAPRIGLAVTQLEDRLVPTVASFLPVEPLVAPDVPPTEMVSVAVAGRTPPSLVPLGSDLLTLRPGGGGSGLGSGFETNNTPAAAKVERFVRQVYVDVLQRPADPNGLNFFATGLFTGVLSRQQVVDSIVFSEENYVRAVAAAYQFYLNRPVDSAGLQTFTGLLRNGAGYDQVIIQLTSSPEYFIRSGGSPSGLVINLYTDSLGRFPAQSEIQFWTNLFNNGLSQNALATSIVNSRESFNRQVLELYVNMLRRPADIGGLNVFTDFLQSGGRYQDVQAIIVASDEYFIKA